MATTMKGVIGGGTTFSASPATVSVPTGKVSVTRNTTFTVPAGVKVIYVSMDNPKYVGVTPNSTHRIEWRYGSRTILRCTSHNKDWGTNNHSSRPRAIISWSPSINTHTPDVNDY